MASATSPRHLPIHGQPPGADKTLRTDNWWAGPLVTFIILSAFIVYATFRAFENKYFHVGSYLTPFYSPYIPITGIPLLTPAMLILPGPASFRLTCYYYRKAYYRAFAMDPPACAVAERNPHGYNGETKLLLFQNLHRYAVYLAIVFLAFLWKDAIESLFWAGPRHTTEFHVGLGSVVMFVNVILLTIYTCSCHSVRHLLGGGVDSYSTAPFGKLRANLWKWVTPINGTHMLWAWMSLFSVALTDLYIRSVGCGAILDLRLI